MTLFDGAMGQAPVPNQPTGSAGLFAQYMAQNKRKKTPTFMPPTMGSLQAPMMGGLGSGLFPGFNDGNGVGGDGGMGSTGYGQTNANGEVGIYGGPTGGMVSAGRAAAGLLGGPLGSALGQAAFGPQSNWGIQAQLADLYGLQNMAVTPGFFGFGGEGNYGDSSIGNGPGGADGQAGDAGSSDAGSTGAGSDTGSDAGQGGDGTGSGGDTGSDGWAKGGMVTKARLKGKNPAGPDDGFGALDIGELVVPAKIAKKLPKHAIAGLLGRRA